MFLVVLTVKPLPLAPLMTMSLSVMLLFQLVMLMAPLKVLVPLMTPLPIVPFQPPFTVNVKFAMAYPVPSKEAEEDSGTWSIQIVPLAAGIEVVKSPNSVARSTAAIQPLTPPAAGAASVAGHQIGSPLLTISCAASEPSGTLLPFES